MTSALACVGLAVSDGDELQWLVTSAHRAIGETGIFDGVRVGRWQDDSGAALILGWQSGELLDFAPAYTAASGGLLAGCRLINESVAVRQGRRRRRPPADRDDVRSRAVPSPARPRAPGQRTRQDHRPRRRRHHLPRRGRLRRLALVASSDPSPGSASEPPPHYRENGWAWPPRLGAESFISHGVFADPAQAGSRARLSGTVLDADRHVCALTGQPFIVAAVRTAGFEADLCLAAGDHPEVPVPGNIISGTVVLSAAIDTPLLNGARA